MSEINNLEFRDYPSHRSFWGVLTGLLGIIFFAVLAGALIAATSLPAVYLLDKGATTAQNFANTLPTKLAIGTLQQKSNLYARDAAGNNILLASFYDQNRQEIDMKVLPKFVSEAALAAEDPRFYEHGGIDLKGITRAFLSNASGNDLQGGSTISQQYVKNVLVQKAEAINDPKERVKAYKEATKTNLNRKLIEANLAINLEKRYSKDKILGGYLNIVGFGTRVYGVQSASNYYFGVNAADLNLSQAATLMGIINSPNTLRIDRPDDVSNGAANGYKLATDRRNYVLNSMLKHNMITNAQFTEAKNSKIEPKITQPSTGCQTAGDAAYFCDYVTGIIKTDPVYGKTAEARRDLLQRGGLSIYTTLDLDLQARSREAIAATVPDSQPGMDLGTTSVSMQPGTGKILAMAQNKQYSADPEVAKQSSDYTSINYNADFAHGGSTGFQPGSTYKLFTLMEWLRTGHNLYKTVPGKTTYTHFTNSCEGDWNGKTIFKNDNGSGGYRISPMNATKYSINTGYMTMAEQLDLCGIRKMAEDLGVHAAPGGTLASNPTSVIGTNEVAPLQMATAYAATAAGGITCDPIAIESITGINGKVLPVPSANCRQTVDPAVAGAAIVALQGTLNGGTTAADKIYDGIPMIAKTGTTDKSVHTWIIGSTTNVTTAVWVGNVTGSVGMRTIAIRGTNAALIRHSIFKSVMTLADQKYGGGQFVVADPKLVAYSRR